MRYQVTLSQRARPTRAWCGAMNQRAQAKTKTKNRNIPGIAHRTSSKVRRELRLCPTGLLMLRSVLRTDEMNVLARYQVALSHPSHPSPRTNHHHHHHKKANRKTKPRRRRRHAKTKRVRVRMTLCRVFPSTSAPTYEYARRIGSSVRRLAIYAYSSPSPSTRDANDARARRRTHLAQQRTQNLDLARANHREHDDDDDDDDDDRVAAYPHHAPIAGVTARVPGRTPRPIVVVVVVVVVVV